MQFQRIYYLLNKYVTYVVVISQNLFNQCKNWRTLQVLFENYKSFVKKCIRCGHFYRYQESFHGMRNYDDRLFLDINVCLYLREHLLNHNSISSFVDLYNSVFDTNILHQRVLCNYLTFDVLSSVETEYFCNICGHHPWALVMDLNKKICWKCPVNEIVAMKLKMKTQ